MLLKTDDGFGIAAPANDGGFASIGSGASRVTPAGGWKLDQRMTTIDTSYVEPQATGASSDSIPRSRVPVPRGWPFSAPKPDKPADAPKTDTQSLLDLFAAMFGARSTKDDTQSGSVVVYGDPANNSGGGSSLPIGGILIGGAVIGAGIWLYKKYA